MVNIRLTMFSHSFLGMGEDKCKKNYNLIGCYEEYNPGVLLFNDRHNIKWNDITKYMEGYKAIYYLPFHNNFCSKPIYIYIYI